jgi:hypothetical protein
VAHIPCVHVIPSDIRKPCHFGNFWGPHHLLVTSSFPITLTLQASRIQEFSYQPTSNYPELRIFKQANLSPCVLLERTTNIHFRYSPGVHGYAPHILLNLTVEAYFGSSDFRDLNFQNLSGPTGFYPKPWIW